MAAEDPFTYFAKRGFGLRTWQDAVGAWWADITAIDDGQVVAPQYGSGESADDAALRAQRRYHVEQGPDPPLPRRLP